MNERDNDTKLAIAAMQVSDSESEPANETDKDALLEKMREFDLKLQLDKDRLAFDKNNIKIPYPQIEVQREQIKSRPKTNTTK